MHKIDIKEAEGMLAELIAEAAHGEEVVITGKDGASVKLVPFAEARPKFGSARGLVEMADDFDAPLEDFEDYGP